MRMVMAGVALLVAAPATAQDVEPDGPDIVVTAGKPLKLDAKVLRAGQRRFAEDRAVLSPEGSLRFELWRGGRRVPAGTVPIVLSDGKGQELPVTIDGDGTDDVLLSDGSGVVQWKMLNGGYAGGAVLATGITGFDII